MGSNVYISLNEHRLWELQETYSIILDVVQSESTSEKGLLLNVHVSE
jgi:hypothetical protein